MWSRCHTEGLYYCAECGREWRDELPPLWAEWWPECCGERAHLAQPLKSSAPRSPHERLVSLVGTGFSLTWAINELAPGVLHHLL